MFLAFLANVMFLGFLADVIFFTFFKLMWYVSF